MTDEAKALVVRIEVELLMGNLRTISDQPMPMEEKLERLAKAAKGFSDWVDEYAKTSKAN